MHINLEININWFMASNIKYTLSKKEKKSFFQLNF